MHESLNAPVSLQMKHAIGAALLVVLLCGSFPLSADAADFKGLARVQEDGTLKLRGRTVRLFGIYLPPSGRTCGSSLRPVRCGSRAVLALDFKIRGFVRCEPKARYRDRSLSATCWTKGDGSVLAPEVDLAAWLIQRGWALARPDAPFEYHGLERIDRARGRGVWGFQADSITRR